MPNCRHTINLWRDGDPLPESIDNTDNERRYKLEQQQRALEREIRRAKRKVEGFTYTQNIKKAKAELRKAQKELSDFINQTNASEGVTVLKRDYGKEAVYEGEVNKAKPNALTLFTKDDTITDKEFEFKKRLKAGEFKTEIYPNDQNKHIYGKAWKNQVKRAILFDEGAPRSVLAKSLDPATMVEKYGGTGKIIISGDNNTVNEFITLPFETGKTFDKSLGKYVDTHVIQIKYTDKGTHVFPTSEGGGRYAFYKKME